MTMQLPPDRDRRRDKHRRISHGYTHLRVTKATARLVVEVARAIDALSVDEVLFYLSLSELGLERAKQVLAAAPRPGVTRSVVPTPSMPHRGSGGF